MKPIRTSLAPAAIGPYSQAVSANGVVYVSGQIPIDPETGDLLAGTIAEQTARIAASIKAILNEAGTGFEHVVKTTCYLTDMAHFGEFNTEYARHFVSNPARECVQVSALPKGAEIEISVIAVLP
ncbi:Enamine/imine deaminase [Slackia heliotrinireducens]|uniref:Endoribonuclease L-PSP, putative n=1 Tax=Slackia heliotrinireducens (strain ATCC 29202 / DSM 20476 / NCTC 11029 / RHS 1) TaxID=471855 RepID=C7N8C4_SLAHD|nr:RidA family protein [Slackia heliotrinireducens]ACV23159.1 endoribonuclease L-PSP, putative [Slackia heliotrinireducens DSM 20476]VEH02214.1 Enamine/imine deaminase [Slackia heliotrinireducens]